MRFKIVEDIEEAFLDSDEKFYDYRTGTVNGKNIFDVSKSGVSFYDNFLTEHGRKYMHDNKNLSGEIVKMSPNEYFSCCADIFGSTVDRQKRQTLSDTGTINHLTEVIEKYHKQFPITMLNYAENTQEGRHRMAVAGNLLGYDTEFPVLVVKSLNKTIEEPDDANVEVDDTMDDTDEEPTININDDDLIDYDDDMSSMDMDEFIKKYLS